MHVRNESIQVYISVSLIVYRMRSTHMHARTPLASNNLHYLILIHAGSLSTCHVTGLHYLATEKCVLYIACNREKNNSALIM